MNDLFNPDKIYRQKDIAELLNITDRTLRTLVAERILPEAKPRSGYQPLACIHAYINYKSKSKLSQEKPEVGAGEPEQTEDEKMEREERLLKLDDKRETVAMKRAKRVLFEKSYIPIDMMVDVLQQIGGNLATRHDNLISNMKLAWPDMPMEAVEVLTEEMTKAANECADIQPDLSGYVDSDEESYPSWIVGTEENNSGNGY